MEGSISMTIIRGNSMGGSSSSELNKYFFTNKRDISWNKGKLKLCINAFERQDLILLTYP